MAHHHHPMSLAHFGVSQDALNSLRYPDHSGPKSAVAPRATQQQQSTASGAVDAPPPASAPQAPQKYRAARLSVKELGHHSLTDAEVQVLRSRQASRQHQAQQHSAQAMEQQGTSAHMLTSRLYQTAPSLAVTDFTALASSSVGGPSLRRPHTRFVASRNGDGNAVWVRRPLLASEQDSQQGRSGGSGGTVAAENSQQGRGQSPEQGRGPRSPVGSPSSLRRGAGSPGSRREGSPVGEAVRRGRRQSLPVVPQFDPPSFKRPFTSGMLPAAQGVPPRTAPAYASSWFQPPAATFLGGVPHQLPSTPAWGLRVDCGYSTERDFLMGASTSQRARHPPPPSRGRLPWPSAPTPPPPNPSTPPLTAPTHAAPLTASHDERNVPGNGAEGEGAMSPSQLPSVQPHVAPWTGTGPLNPDSPHASPRGAHYPLATASSSLRSPTSSVSPRHASPPGYQRLHGVWRPDTAASDAVVLATAGFAPLSPPPQPLQGALGVATTQQPAVPPSSAAADAPGLQAAVGQGPPGVTLAALWPIGTQPLRAAPQQQVQQGALGTAPAILQAIKDSSRPAAVRPIEFVFRTECRKALPSEATLPRRNVPAGGR